MTCGINACNIPLRIFKRSKFCHLLRTFANSLDPDQDQLKIKLVRIRVHTIWYSDSVLEEFFEKLFWKQSADNNKTMKSTQHARVMVKSLLTKYLDKHHRPRSDCFCRSRLIRIFPFCYSDKHFVNSSPDNQHFIWEEKEKSFWKF